MARLIPEILDPGDVISGTDQVEFFDAIEDLSADIKAENYRVEAVGAPHILYSSDPVWAYNDSMAYTGSSYTETHTSYTKVDAGGHAMELTSINISLKEGDVVRIYARLLSGAPSLGNRAFDFYSFKFWLTFAGAGGGPVGPDFAYSLQGCNTANLGVAANDEIADQCHLLSYTYIHSGSTDTLQKVECRVAIQNAANSFDIRRYNLVVMVSKH